MNMMNKHSDEARCASGSEAALNESAHNKKNKLECNTKDLRVLQMKS